MIPISQASSFTEMKWGSVRMCDFQPTFRDEKSDDEISEILLLLSSKVMFGIVSFDS